MGVLIFILLALAAGCGLSVQAGVNARLGADTGLPVWATLSSFLLGFLFLLPFTLLPRPAWPALEHLGTLRWWTWTGGLIGAAYVLSTIVIAPRLGATVFFSIVVAGQIIMALILDNYGWLDFPRHSMNPMRLLGAALMIAGVIIVRRF
jgi:bacterial/archaeal transporter family-2 protein